MLGCYGEENLGLCKGLIFLDRMKIGPRIYQKEQKWTSNSRKLIYYQYFSVHSAQNFKNSKKYEKQHFPRVDLERNLGPKFSTEI